LIFDEPDDFGDYIWEHFKELMLYEYMWDMIIVSTSSFEKFDDYLEDLFLFFDELVELDVGEYSEIKLPLADLDLNLRYSLLTSIYTSSLKEQYPLKFYTLI
jgi:hypothetical protein